ncbi:hypothetical protein [Dactylosporangium fulvum]|uniref:Endonuclease/exonuclease/phosphatase n=1 Tax=Dactylosporangium fulvum TaxID=53359 RepID=A0ABY5VQB2_9ACTN|nr:hypothetical protein [Dactylosporangium fulvum]UWP79347.1 hypothetical protein Dfulv_29790 [Dactylosporangium fulvum]
MRLATFNVENLFARAKAMDTTVHAEGQPALSAFETFNRIAAHATYTDEDKATMLDALQTLGVLVQTRAGRRLNKDQFDTAWALLRENRGDFLVAPADREPRIVASGRGDWTGWVELTVEPVDETSTRMTAKVINEVAADVLCLVEAENRPSLVRFNEELLGGRYGHAMLVDGNDPRGIDVGLLCADGIDVDWVRSHVDVPDPQRPGKRLFSRDCPLYKLRLPGGADLYLLINHLKSQSDAGGAARRRHPAGRRLRPRRVRRPLRPEGPASRAPRHVPVVRPGQPARLHPAVTGTRSAGHRGRRLPQGPVGQPGEQEPSETLGGVRRDRRRSSRRQRPRRRLDRRRPLTVLSGRPARRRPSPPRPPPGR